MLASVQQSAVQYNACMRLNSEELAVYAIARKYDANLHLIAHEANITVAQARYITKKLIAMQLICKHKMDGDTLYYKLAVNVRY